MRPVPMFVSFALILFFGIARAEDPKPPGSAGATSKPQKSDLPMDEQKLRIENLWYEYQELARNHDVAQNRQRRRCAQKLGDYDHPEALQRLWQIFENDSEIRVRVAAQIAIGRVADGPSFKKLFRAVQSGSNRERVLQEYMGQSIAELTNEDAIKYVIRRLPKVSQKWLRLSCVEGLGALRAQGALDMLVKLYGRKKTRKDTALRYELIIAIGRIGGVQARNIVVNTAKEPDWRIRSATAQVILQAGQDKECVDLARDLMNDEISLVREHASISVGEAKNMELAPHLVTLMRKGTLRVKGKAYEALRRLSGQDKGLIPDAWDKWIKDKKEGKLTEEGGRKDKDDSVSFNIPTYYNFKVLSDRVLFIVDVSGSMKWPMEPPHRIDVAKAELLKVVKQLQGNVHFNVATFAGAVNFWQKGQMVPATERNLKSAKKWIDSRLLPRGGTNTYDALMKGIQEIEHVDTIFFLSDGTPSVGKTDVPEEILADVRKANRYRKVQINTISLIIGKAAITSAQKYEDPEEMADFLRTLAEENGGTLLDLREAPKPQVK
ncbi:MAG: VWA domain-containing protein [Planctomycetota bacterium]